MIIIKRIQANRQIGKSANQPCAHTGAVLADLDLARAYGIKVVPTLIINEKYSLAGAVSQVEIEKALDNIIKQNGA